MRRQALSRNKIYAVSVRIMRPNLGSLEIPWELFLEATSGSRSVMTTHYRHYQFNAVCPFGFDHLQII
jgi:hypothetical protein